MPKTESHEGWSHETGDREATLQLVKEAEEELAIIKDLVEKNGRLDLGLFFKLKKAVLRLQQERLAEEQRAKKHEAV